MQRRDVITTLGTLPVAGLAGCVSDGDPTESGDEPADGTAGNGSGPDSDDSNDGDYDSEKEREPADDVPGEYQVVSPPPETPRPIRHEVSVSQPDIHSPDGPLTIEVVVENPTEQTVRYGERRSTLAAYLTDQAFTLVPPGSGEQRFDEETELWYLEEPVAITMDWQVGELEPGQSHSQELVLVYDHGTPPASLDVPEQFEFGSSFGTTTDENGMPEDPDYTFEFSLVDGDATDSSSGVLGCPPHPTDREWAVCSDAGDAVADVSMDVHPASSHLEDGLPDEAVTLTLENGSDSDLEFNPHSWQLRRYEQDEWTEIGGGTVGDGAITLAASESRTWSLRAVVESVTSEGTIEPGLYTATIGVPHPEVEGEWIACIAVVRLQRPE